MFDLRNKNIYVGSQKVLKGYLGTNLLYNPVILVLPDAARPKSLSYAYDFTSNKVTKYLSENSSHGISFIEGEDRFTAGGYLLGKDYSTSYSFSSMTASLTINQEYLISAGVTNKILWRRSPSTYPYFTVSFVRYDQSTDLISYEFEAKTGTGISSFTVRTPREEYLEITIVGSGYSGVTVYFNGVEVQSRDYKDYKYAIGTGRGTYHFYSPYVIHDYKIYDEQLTPEEVEFNYNNVRQRLQNL